MDTIPLRSILPFNIQPYFKSYLHVKKGLYGNGIVPTIDLEPDTILTHFPLTNAPSIEQSKNNTTDDLDEVDQSSCATDLETIETGEWLLDQVNLEKRSIYYKWIAQLPMSFNLFNQSIDIEYYDAIQTRNDKILQHYELFRSKHFTTRATTMEQYEWAMSMVISRSYDVEGRRYLLPGLDFFNHCNDGDVNQVDVDIFENTIYVLTSKRHVKMKELCINFSRLEKMPKKDSILQYGFG